MRFCFILVAVLASTSANALYRVADDAPPSTGDAMVCEVVKAYVDLYGLSAVEKYVKDHRWSKERVAAARKCLSK